MIAMPVICSILAWLQVRLLASNWVDGRGLSYPPWQFRERSHPETQSAYSQIQIGHGDDTVDRRAEGEQSADVYDAK
jgi:hypothetical protein